MVQLLIIAREASLAGGERKLKNFIFVIGNYYPVAIGSVLLFGIVLFVIPNAGSGDQFEIVIFAIAVFIGTTLFYFFISTKISNLERIGGIKLVMIDDMARFERARDLFYAAEHHKKAAYLNNISSVGVLILVCLFVGFAGKFINQDTVQFAGNAKLETDLKNMREDYIPSLPSKTISIEEIAQMAKERSERINFIQGAYVESVRKQIEAEAAISSPLYRMASSFLLRISVVGVGIYLVVILNRAYKYNNSMSTSYRVRYISMLKGDESIDEFVKYNLALSVLDIDYSADIEHPTERISMIFEKILAIFKK